MSPLFSGEYCLASIFLVSNILEYHIFLSNILEHIFLSNNAGSIFLVMIHDPIYWRITRKIIRRVTIILEIQRQVIFSYETLFFLTVQIYIVHSDKHDRLLPTGHRVSEVTSPLGSQEVTSIKVFPFGKFAHLMWSVS